MPPFLYRCPITASGVHGFVVVETPSDEPDCYEPVTCFACGQMHLVNFKTGKTVGEHGETGFARASHKQELLRQRTGHAYVEEPPNVRYRRKARECLALLPTFARREEHECLIGMAQAWMKLAEVREKKSQTQAVASSECNIP